jgi:hypothetical protein
MAAGHQADSGRDHALTLPRRAEPAPDQPHRGTMIEIGPPSAVRSQPGLFPSCLVSHADTAPSARIPAADGTAVLRTLRMQLISERDIFPNCFRFAIRASQNRSEIVIGYRRKPTVSYIT